MAFTVSAALSGGTDQLNVLYVVVLTGAAATQNGATASASGFSGVPAAKSVTPNATGSYVYGTAVSWNNAGVAYTANASTTFAAGTNTANGNTDFAGFRSTAKTTAATPVTVGASAPTVATLGAIAMAEILAAGTLAEDATTPAPVAGTGNSLTTASFTPPVGSLLVASACGSGAGGPYTITVSDTSGTGQVWVPLAFQSIAGNDAAGVWIAVAGTDSGPNYAGAAADLGGGTGSWATPGNADGAPDTTYAVWTP